MAGSGNGHEGCTRVNNCTLTELYKAGLNESAEKNVYGYFCLMLNVLLSV